VSEYAAPVLPSRDLHETVAFYARLGFENAGDAPDVWDYAIVRRDAIELHFYLDADPDRGGTASSRCFVWVDDVDALHGELAAAGVAVGDLFDMDYGMRLFTVTDPTGNDVRFGTGPH